MDKTANESKFNKTTNNISALKNKVENNEQSQQFKQTYSQFGGPSQMIGMKIAKLQEQGCYYAKKLEQETKKLENIEQEITKTEEILDKKRKEIMENKRLSNKNDPVLLQLQIKALTGRQETMLTKLNNSMAHNQALKESINDLRREKNIYDKIYEDLKFELQEKKDKLRIVLMESKNAKMEIEEGTKRLLQFKQEDILDKEKFEKEFNSVFNILDPENRDEKMKEKFGQSYIQKKSINNDDRQSKFLTQPDDLNFSPKRKILKEKDKKSQLEFIKQEVTNYEQIFEKLKNETNSNDMDEIVRTLVEYEEQNYRLFQNINHLRADFDSYQKQKQKLLLEINDLKNNSSQYMSDPRIKKILDLKNEISILKSKKQVHIEKKEELMNIINNLKVSLPIMYERIGCNKMLKAKEQNLILTNPDDIDENNLLSYLGIVEQRTNDLLAVYNDTYILQIEEKSGRQESKNSVLRKTEDIYNYLDTLKDEFQTNNDRLKEDKRKLEQQQFEIKEKHSLDILDLEQLRDNARVEIKKITENHPKNKGNKKK